MGVQLDQIKDTQTERVEGNCNSIPKTRTKAVLAKRVFNWLFGEDFRNQYKKLISNIKSHQSNSLHTTYYENFNSEDLFNKALLSSLGKLTFENWRCKLTYAVKFLLL